ncbi:amidase [Blautia producta]|uniref:N-acetylmuramoyl-L-alanine amidase n=1 Tax=Blautia producta TaxID=33035 RepID=UPI00210EC038|nr:amidase [Blautia producta]MCQ5127512.1 amidase [Blautia producta]
MAYTNSKMVAYTKLSPNHSGQRTHSIDRITPHCVVGQCTAEGLGDWFAKSSTQASSNYGIDKNGRVGLYVEEKNRSWCSSSNANDQRAVTIECASDTKEPYWMNDKVYASLIKLCVDICKRNGKKKLLWFANKDKTLNYAPKSDEMVLTVHRWFANKSCPGNWLYARLGDLAAKVTAELSGGTSDTGDKKPVTQMYRVRKSWSDAKSQIGAYKVLNNAKKKVDENSGYKVFDASGNVVYPATSTPAPTPSKDASYKVQVSIANLNIRKGPGTNYDRTGQFTGKGIFTIVQESKGAGATLWGKLKSGAGWISLDFAKKL